MVYTLSGETSETSISVFSTDGQSQIVTRGLSD